MRTIEINEQAEENKAILEHWRDQTLDAFPGHAQRAQQIINQLLQEHDPKKWEIYTFQKQPEFAIFHTLGYPHYLIAQILYNYERMGREIDQMFVRLCKAHLQLLPPDENVTPWVNPHDE